MQRRFAWVTVAILALAGLSSAGPVEAAFSPAKYGGKLFCPKGAFYTPRGGGECWSCRGGRHNAALPVEIEGVCSRPGYIEHGRASLAPPTGRSFKTECKNGYRLDVGARQCYSCGGWKRSTAAVTSPKACFKLRPGRAGYNTYKKARLKEPTGRVAKVNCGRGYGYDVGKKTCYRCGKGWTRTTRPVTDEKACFKPVAPRPPYPAYRKAGLMEPTRKVVEVFCKQGYRYDLRTRQCYRCGDGWLRTAQGVETGRACFRRVAAQPYKASFARKFGCGRGQFFDPRKGGQCWSCPRGYIRTVSPVTGKRACTNDIGEIFAGDKGAMCRKLIGEMKKGSERAKKLLGEIQDLTRPVSRPINALMDKMSPQVKTPRELLNLLSRVTAPMDANRAKVEALASYASQVRDMPTKIRNILLDPRLMCDGKPARIERQLIDAGLRPGFMARRAGLFDGLLIRPAHAALPRERPFMAFFASVGGRSPADPLGPVGTITLITDFRGTVRVYGSVGGLFVKEPGVGISVGWLAFLKSSVEDFSGMQQLGVGFGLGFGPNAKFKDDWLESLPGWKAKSLKAFLTGQIVFSFSPPVNVEKEFYKDITGMDKKISLNSGFYKWPGFGTSWTYTPGKWDPKMAKKPRDTVEELESGTRMRDWINVWFSIDHSWRLDQFVRH